MGQINRPAPVLLLVASISRYRHAHDWARQQLAAAWGSVALASQPLDFTETDYYAASMGTDLTKVFFAFERLIDPGQLPALKCQTNRWEDEYRDLAGLPELRPLNLDPGYLTEAKLVLASTKDHAHRLYLSEGIYGEVTLYYHKQCWQYRDWTYPDYRRTDYHQFFDQCRQYLRDRRPAAADS